MMRLELAYQTVTILFTVFILTVIVIGLLSATWLVAAFAIQPGFRLSRRPVSWETANGVRCGKEAPDGGLKGRESPRLEDGANSRGYHSSFSMGAQPARMAG
jgi:hypothetical protein